MFLQHDKKAILTYKNLDDLLSIALWIFQYSEERAPQFISDRVLIILKGMQEDQKVRELLKISHSLEFVSTV